MVMVRKPSKLLAQSTPKVWYMAMANSGKPAPKKLRTNVFAEIAELATSRYTSTMYLKPWMKITNMAAPTGIPATTCAGQGVPGCDVQPNQKRPMGRRTAPTIMGGRRRSGTSTPGVDAIWRANMVRECTTTPARPSRLPTRMPKKARALICGFQCRSSWKEIG